MDQADEEDSNLDLMDIQEYEPEEKHLIVFSAELGLATNWKNIVALEKHYKNLGQLHCNDVFYVDEKLNIRIISHEENTTELLEQYLQDSVASIRYALYEKVSSSSDPHPLQYYYPMNDSRP